MPVPTIEIAYLGTIYAPLSGLPADSDDGPNEDDSTLLFTYYGDSGVYGHMHRRLVDVVGEDWEDTGPLDIAAAVQIGGGLVVVDTDWDGINYYGFAPAESDISFTPGN